MTTIKTWINFAVNNTPFLSGVGKLNYVDNLKSKHNMPYENNSALPGKIQQILPKNAQDIYRETFNDAFLGYKDPQKRWDNSSREEVSHKIAWLAVKDKYKKDERTGKWVLKRLLKRGK